MTTRPIHVGSVHWVQWGRWDDIAGLVAWFTDPWTVGVVRSVPIHPMDVADPHDYIREVPLSHIHERLHGEQAESLAAVAAHNLAEFVGQEEASRLLGKPVRSLAS